MVMNDLMERDKKVSALAILDECDIKGDLKHIVGGWKYQREREWAGTTDSKHKIGKMSSTHGPRAGSPRQPSKGNEMCWVFGFFFFFHSRLRAKRKRSRSLDLHVEGGKSIQL